MVCIELKPNLSSCIETLSKKEYEQTLSLLLKEEHANEELVGQKVMADVLHLANDDKMGSSVLYSHMLTSS